MTEPNAASNGLLAALAAAAAWVSPALAQLVSPLFADAFVIAVGALGGAFLAVMDRETEHRAALRVALRGFAMSCLFSGVASVLIGAIGPEYLRGGSYAVLLAVAGGIAWKQERIAALLGRVIPALAPTKGKR